jgi:hypothetical protein
VASVQSINNLYKAQFVNGAFPGVLHGNAATKPW